MKKGFVIAMGVVAPLVANAMQEESSFAKTLAMGSDSVRVVPVVNESSTDENDTEIKRKGENKETLAEESGLKEEMITIEEWSQNSKFGHMTLKSVNINYYGRDTLTWLTQIQQLANKNKWEEICGLLDENLYNNQQLEIDLALEDRLDDVYTAALLRAFERTGKREYNPCYLFCTFKNLQKFMSLKDNNGREFVEEGCTLLAASVYLSAFNSYQEGLSDAEKISKPYKIALRNLNKQELQNNYLEWAIHEADSDKKTLQIATEWHLRPSL